MKKVLTTIALSLSALLATSAMAAPQHDPRYDHNPHKPAPHWNAKDSKKWNDDRHQNNRAVNPSRDWRVGQALPRQYDNKRFQVSDREARRLPNAGRFQQWYKVNNDYVLVNERNNRIIRIIN
ncbi:MULTISPECIES: RcnB family protein [unclassified Acinetobacter]|uniref:RcnB family protein n=1 Tax=unclassified Acinetobacter TaxID=196816 RepID=UPI001C23CFE1|nr:MULTISPECIES: RcnB family protein [unclassified Acinetobacter]